MKISQITEDNTPNIATMMNGKAVEREAGCDPDHTKPYNQNNPVAKHARKFNKAAVHRDRKNDYSRKTKHKGKDLAEAPIVVHGRSDLTNMIKTEFDHWIAQSHTVEELTKLMSAMGLRLKSDGERSVIGE
jgi:hypothetical protein